MTTLFARLLRPPTSIISIGIPTRPICAPIEIRRQSSSSDKGRTRRGKNFSPQEDAHIIQRRNDGATGTMIAAELPGRTARSVQSRCIVLASKQLLRLRRRRAPPPRSQLSRYGQPFTQADEKIVLERFKTGVPVRQIAIELGRTRSAAESYISKLRSTGLHAVEPRHHKRPFTPAEDQKMLTLRSQGTTILDIAQEMGRTYAAINSRLLEHRSRRLQQLKRPKVENWTHDEIDNLVEAYKSGKRIVDIVDSSWRSYGAVKQTLYLELERRGLQRLTPKKCEPWTPAQVAQLVQLRQVQQLPWGKVADIIGKSKTACQHRFYYQNTIKRKPRAD